MLCIGTICLAFSNDKEIVEKLDDIHQVGTFAQIAEYQELQDRQRLLIMGYRRIKITGLARDIMDVEPGMLEIETESAFSIFVLV